MVNNEIWLDSHATVSMIPEQDIYLGAFLSATDDGNTITLTLGSGFTGNFSLLADLYRGCFLDLYAIGDHDTLVDRTMIQSNTATTITVLDSLSFAAASASGYYGVIRSYGAPVPAPKGASAGSTYVAQVLSIGFASDTSSDYDNDTITFGQVPTANGTASTQYVIGLDQAGDATVAGANLIVDISDTDLTTAEEIIDTVVAAVAAQGGIHFSAARSGTNLVLTNTYGGVVATPASPAVSDATNLLLSTTTAGATNSSTNPRLLSDNWFGLASSITVPGTSVEPKQINVGIGGTRNFTYQFKGTETTSEFGLDAMANSFPWLYYALGSVSAVSGTTTADTLNGSGAEDFDYTTSSQFLISNNQLHRVIGNQLCPPVDSQKTAVGTSVATLNDTTSALTYTITENDSSELPSFAVEYVLKKPNQTSTVATDSAKENVYCKIFPGCVVNNLTLTAAAGQEVTCNISAMPKNTFVAPANYETLNNVTDVSNFVNFGTRNGDDESNPSACEGRMRPFFFSDGTIELFGQEFLQLENMTLTIDNALQQKRYIGAYDKRSQFALAGQRTYNLTFTGLVTDATLFDYFRREHAFSLNGINGSEVILRFTKDNGESMELKFEDYHVTQAEFPLTNDNGPLMVNWTIVPLALKSCSLTTYWAIQG